MRRLPEELPPEAEVEWRYCIEHDIKSNVAIPLMAGGSILGALTFAFLTRRCEWPAEIIARLQIVGEVFAGALLRRSAEESLRAALAENEALQARLEWENLYLREQVVLKHHHGRIIGQSDALRRVLSEAERVAVTGTPVLLLGETGTGKELLAQTIHELSPRKDRPMVIVNCASLPASLIESELFGAKRAPTPGRPRPGRPLRGRRWLDAVPGRNWGIPCRIAGQNSCGCSRMAVRAFGSPETMTVDVRIIAATNRDLEQAVREGKFRPDLFHRLNVFPIHVPPLRERPEDIPALVWSFVEVSAAAWARPSRASPARRSAVAAILLARQCSRAEQHHSSGR